MNFVESTFDPDELLIGIMMIKNEVDILEENLTHLVNFYDRIFILDGTEPDDEFLRSKQIAERFSEVKLILRDQNTQGPFPVRDGARKYLLEHVRLNYGVNNWIGILHGDEFYTDDPRLFLMQIDPRATPVVQVRLCPFFLHLSDQNKLVSLKTLPVERRITHYMWPGTPEDRFFFDDGRCNYDPAQHSLVVPFPHANKQVHVLPDSLVMKQYNYRDMEQALLRARQRVDSGWQENHYMHIVNDQSVFVESLHVYGYLPCGSDNVKEVDDSKWSHVRNTKSRPLKCIPSAITPIFIGGTERSGSTLVQEILSLSMDVSRLAWESKFISMPSGLMELLHDYSESGLSGFIQNMANSTACTYPEYHCKEVNNWKFRACSGKVNIDHDFDAELRKLRSVISNSQLSLECKSHVVANWIHYLFDRFVDAEKGVAWVEQTPRNIFWAAEILQTFKKGVFINVYRDPRDVIASLLKLWWKPGNLAQGIAYYKERYGWWCSSRNKISQNGQNDRYFELSFESIIESGGQAIEPVLELINAQTGGDYSAVINRNKAHVGRWVNEFSGDEKVMLHEALSAELEALGYN